MRRVQERVLAKGFTQDQFDRAIDEYQLLDVSLSLFFYAGCVSVSSVSFRERGCASADDDIFSGLANCSRGHEIGVH